MLTEKEIKCTIAKTVLKRGMVFWGMLRSISTFGPLIGTYIFANGIAAIEHSESVKDVVAVFGVLLIIEIIEHFLRVLSKSRMAYYSEASMINLQEDFVESIRPSDKYRKETIQTLRNLTQATRRFIEFMYTSGIQGVISFISIPVILFFIDKRVFLIEMVLVAIYMFFTFYFSRLYEKWFELYDEAREKYFAKLLAKNHINKQANMVLQNFKKVQDVFFADWFSLQTLVSIFTFVVTWLIVRDIFEGVKAISDLILIIGYVKESKAFLNNTSSSINHYMEINAGVERVSIMSRQEGLTSHKLS